MDYMPLHAEQDANEVRQATFPRPSAGSEPQGRPARVTVRRGAGTPGAGHGPSRVTESSSPPDSEWPGPGGVRLGVPESPLAAAGPGWGPGPSVAFKFVTRRSRSRPRGSGSRLQRPTAGRRARRPPESRRV
jgi:hypothetical protein